MLPAWGAADWPAGATVAPGGGLRGRSAAAAAGLGAAVGPAPIFRDFMAAALKDKPPTPFRVAPGIELVTTNAITGLPTSASDPNAIQEAYKAGTAPGEPNAPTFGIIGGAAAATQTPASTDVGEGTGGLY